MSPKRCVIYLTAGLCGMMLMASCSVGPNYKRPAVNSPAAFRANDAATNGPTSEMAWWQVYEDDTLQGYMREALTNNYDLRIAIARVEQSRAIAMQARSQFVPTASYGGTVTRGRNDVSGSPFPNGGATGSSVSAALNTFWEVDLWGRVRRLNESARAEFLASEEDRRGVRLSLLSEVAGTYFQLLELDEELDVAGRTTNSFAESLRIFNQRLAGGTASGLESSRAEAAMDDAAAAVPAMRQRISATENQLCVLLGRNPGPIARPTLFLTEITLPMRSGGVALCLTRKSTGHTRIRAISTVCQRANWRNRGGVFPQNWTDGISGKSESGIYPLSHWAERMRGASRPKAPDRCLKAGRLVGKYRQTKAAREEATLRYQQTILNAFREVSDALVSREQLAEVRKHEAHEVVALETAVRLSSERYTAGKASYYEVLEAQQQLFPAQLNLARTQRDQLLAIVTLYKALGGGWRAEETPPASK